MNDNTVALTYLAVVVAAAFLLWRFSHVRWYWHVLAVAVAFGLGFMPPLVKEQTILYDAALGAAFLFLLFWGAGEPLFKAMHLPRHR